MNFIKMERLKNGNTEKQACNVELENSTSHYSQKNL